MVNPDEKNHIYWPDVIITVLVIISFIILAITVMCYPLALRDIPEYETTTETIIPTGTSIPVTEETIHIETTEILCEAPKSSVTTETGPAVDPYDVELLALIIYQEAGGDAVCDDCRRRVADVVLNRVADWRFPDSIEGVITQRAQYGRLYWTGIVWPARASLREEQYAVERAYRIAEEVLSGQHSELYGEGWIYQAEFTQGETVVSCCGIYFGR